MKALAGLALAAALAPPGLALADTSSGPLDGPRWYGALDVGYHWPLTIDSHSTRPAPDGAPYDWRWRTNSSWAALGRVGWRATNHIRLELEAGYRQSSLKSVAAPGGGVNGFSVARPQEPYGLCSMAAAPPPCLQPGGRDKNWVYAETLFANAIYDFAPQRRLDPFVGAGIGVTHVQWNANYDFSAVPGPITPTNPAVQRMQLGGTVDRLSQASFQVLAGVSWRATQRLNVDATYRLAAAPFLRWNTDNNSPGVDDNHGLQAGDFKGAMEDEAITLGVRYGF